MNGTAAAGAVATTTYMIVVILFAAMRCVSGWGRGCCLALPGMCRCAPPSSMSTWAYLSSDPSRDLPRHRQRPLHRTIGRHSRRRRGRFAGIHEYSVSFANSGPANVALEATDGAAVGASEEGAARACDAAPQEQGNGCRIDRRQQDRRQQRERRRMRLRAFEDRKDAMPAVECAATEADDGDVEANVVRSAAVDARKILAQRAGQLQQRRGWQSRSSERDAAATSVKLGGDMRASDSRFMRMALRLAEKARAEGEVPIGAILVETLPTGGNGGQRVLSTGRNDVERRRDASAHAEVLCLKAAAKERDNWRLAGTTLYVTMEPCVMCLSAAQLFRVDRVVFGAPNPRLGACGGWVDLTTERHPFHEVEVMGGVLAEECALIMREFFRSRRSDEGAAHTEHRPAV